MDPGGPAETFTATVHDSYPLPGILDLSIKLHVHDRYPLPSILDLSNKLHGCRFFSCIDLIKGYHQIPMAQEGNCYSNSLWSFLISFYAFWS